LDEVGELPLDMQVKLLRVLQEGEVDPVGAKRPVKVDVRIISATNKDLAKLVADNAFREDLYYRLNVFPIEAPPLRERKEDLPDLVTFFLDKYNRKMGVKARIHDGVLEAISHYDFPGNIRELEHMLEQAIALVGSGVIHADDLLPTTPSMSGKAPGGHALADVVDAAERSAIEAALRECDGSRERAADLHAISPTTLWRKMTRLGVVAR
jgi:two-component system response regulator HydG